MKFGREQTFNQILEWRPWYIQYDLLTHALMASASHLHRLVAEKDRAAAAAAGADMAQLVKIRTANVNEYGYFVEMVVSEITRASNFYTNLLGACRQQIKVFLREVIQLGLVSRGYHFASDDEYYDAGSTISLLQQRHQHVAIIPGDSLDDSFEDSPLVPSTHLDGVGPRYRQKKGEESSAINLPASIKKKKTQHGKTQQKKRPVLAPLQLKHDMFEFYRFLDQCRCFGSLNSETVRKLVKKHRKELGGRLDRHPRVALPLEACQWGGIKDDQMALRRLQCELEGLFIVAFYTGGDSDEIVNIRKSKKEAMRYLQAGATDKDFQAQVFLNSIGVGTCLALMIVALYIQSRYQAQHSP